MLLQAVNFTGYRLIRRTLTVFVFVGFMILSDQTATFEKGELGALLFLVNYDLKHWLKLLISTFSHT